MVLQVEARINYDLYGSWNVLNYHFWFPLLWKRTSLVSPQCRKCEKSKSTLPRNPLVSNRLTGKIRLICDGKWYTSKCIHSCASLYSIIFPEKRTVWCKRDNLIVICQKMMFPGKSKIDNYGVTLLKLPQTSNRQIFSLLVAHPHLMSRSR